MAPARFVGVAVVVVALAGCVAPAADRGGAPASAVSPRPTVAAQAGDAQSGSQQPGAAQAGGAQHASGPAPATPKGYLLFRSTIPDPERLRPYGRAVLELVPRFGGRFSVVANDPEAVEGAPDVRRIVIIEFPSLEAARAFWTSAEYAEVKRLREGVGEIDAILFEGR